MNKKAMNFVKNEELTVKLFWYLFLEGDVLLVDAEGANGPVAGVAQRPLRLQLSTAPIEGHQVVDVVLELKGERLNGMIGLSLNSRKFASYV